MKREYYKVRPNGEVLIFWRDVPERWATGFDKCTKCETTNDFHFANGLCCRCYHNLRGKFKSLRATRKQRFYVKDLNWEEIKEIKHRFREGASLKTLKAKYPDYLNIIDPEDRAWRKKGGCDTAL